MHFHAPSKVHGKTLWNVLDIMEFDKKFQDKIYHVKTFHDKAFHFIYWIDECYLNQIDACPSHEIPSPATLRRVSLARI